jgi:putative ABC transport system ATP-binding protein
MSNHSFELRGVGQLRAGRPVLQDIDLTIPRHVLTVLCGPSGGGKTSLLRLLNRLDDPVRGDVLFEGTPIAEYPVTELRRRVALVFQTPVMFAGTVSDNLAVAAELAGVEDGEFVEQADQAMRLAELDPALLERPGDELSVGQKQRVNLARALMTSPDVLLLDEPTSALDPETSTALMRTIGGLSEERQLTIIVVTHRVSEARKYARHAVVIKDGRAVDSGDSERVLSALPDPDATTDTSTDSTTDPTRDPPTDPATDSTLEPRP